MRKFIVAVILFGFVSCQNQNKNNSLGYSIQKSETDVTIQLEKLDIKLEIVSESIIRVIKSAKGKTDSLPEQLVVIKKPEITDWKVKKKGEEILITTDKVIVEVDKEGNIKFTNIDGSTILEEEKGCHDYVGIMLGEVDLGIVIWHRAKKY